MRILRWLLGGATSGRNDRLAAWGRGVPVSNEQLAVMTDLWKSMSAHQMPSADPLQQLSKDDVQYLLKISASQFRPPEFGNCDALRLAAYRRLAETGYSLEQASILVGMMFNMVGRRDLAE
jgi:hypothetical protein